MNDECKMPEPGPEHAMVVKHAGVWDVDCRFFMAPDAPPMESKAVDTVEVVGPFWTTSRFESDFMGMPFTGACQFGYLPSEQCYVSTWIDCMSTHFFLMKGNFEAGGKVLNLKGEGPNPATGELCPQRIEHEIIDDDSHQMRMFMTMDHGEVKTMEMDYKRRS